MKIHPKPEVLDWPVGWLPEERERLLRHFLTCPTCQERLEEQRAEERLCVSPSASDYDRVLERVIARVQPHIRAADRERGEAPALLTQLLRHPPERREMLVRNSRRFRSFGLYGLILERSREMFRWNPRQAETLAALALALVDSLDAERYGEKLIEDARARCWAFVGNSRRVADDLYRAEEAFQRTEVHLRQGTRDHLLRAEILDFKACLRRAQRQFSEAASLFRRAASIFLWAGETQRAAQAAIGLALVKQYRGEPERALEILEQAGRLIDPRQDQQLHTFIQYNLIGNLVDADRLLEAQALLAQNREIREILGPLNQLRVRWAEARISSGLGRHDDAVRQLAVVRKGFLNHDMSYAAALANLDLAMVFARQRRFEPARRLVLQAQPIFQALGVERECLEAFLLLEQLETVERRQAA